MLHEGQIINDRYVVDSIIAHGGMATVYLVRHEKLKSRHAVKVLDLPTANIRSRLLQEGRIQASLRHPNIVSVTDALEVDGHPALVMEYVDGPSLAEVLEERGAIDLPTAELWFTAIVGAVGYAHDRGLVHRDLKPDNVLMAPLSGGYLVKVTDFGIAKVVQDYMDERNDRHKTRTGTGMGTPAYMPPEQVTNAGQVDHRADIFALGAILYELVTGHRAFPGENLLSIYNASADGDFEPPGALVEDLPDRIVAAIEGCLEPNPEQRIASCKDLLEVVRGERIVSPKTPAPRGERASRLTKPSDPLPLRQVVLEPKRAGGGWLLPALMAMLVAGIVLTLGIVLVVIVGGMAWNMTNSTATTYPTYTTWEPESAMDKFEVEVLDVRREGSVENGVMSYEAGSTDSSLYIIEVDVRYIGENTQMPGAPWALVEDDGTTHDADMGCGMALNNAIQPFRMFSEGERVRGPLCFEAPTNAPGLRLRFKPDPIHGASFWFDIE
jgi:serine/threonine-protein kinase